MTLGLVNCRKCGKTFDYMKTDGICPKCARFFSTTRYNEEEALLKNILDPANENKCSYHGDHDRALNLSGHSEFSHLADNMRSSNIKYRAGDDSFRKKSNHVIITIWVIFVIIYFIVNVFLA